MLPAMNQRISRRHFLGGAAALSAIGCGAPKPSPSAAATKLDFPLVDFHAHPGDDMSLADQVKMAAKRGIKLGSLEHAGRQKYDYGHMISNDEQLNAWIAKLAQYPVYKGIQAEGQDWPACFSKEVIAKLDYALSDALTLPEGPNGFTKIWEPGLKIGDQQRWMDRYTEFHVEKMAGEPLDIMANVQFLPEVIRGEADTLWTEKRMRKIIGAAVKYNVAIEINSRYRLPGEKFLRMAKEAGAKFSFGSNQHGAQVAQLGYCVAMAKKLGLERRDMFVPPPAGHKPIEIRTFA